MAIKSAYELAMERMSKQSPQPTHKLTAKDKEKLAELDRVYSAKIAEQELALKPKIAAARANGDLEGAQKLEETLRAEIAKLRKKLEVEKDAVRQKR
jgi:hypothetical protein